MRKIESLSLSECIRAAVARHRPEGGWDDPVLLDTEDLVVNNGRIFLAKRISGGDTVASAMNYMAVGTVSTAATLTDSLTTGEVVRKAMAVASAVTNNRYQGIATFGGSADGVTSIALVEAGIFNAPGSGQGDMFQRVTFASVTLANSDLLHLTLETVVGSNTI